jgi:ABC-type dipeptide/oligopeptide/nickel transport system permease component
MLSYVARRVLQTIPVLIGVTIIMFLVRWPGVVPGDPMRMIAGERNITPAVREALTKQYGLDKPIYVQYCRYMAQLMRGDLGESYQQRRPVRDILAEKFPNTLLLSALAILVEAVFGIAAGIISAVKKFSFWDIMVTLSTSVLVSVPVFWLGMLLKELFAVKFRQWGLPSLPPSGLSGDEFPLWMHTVLPAITLASVSTAYAARIARKALESGR